MNSGGNLMAFTGISAFLGIPGDILKICLNLMRKSYIHNYVAYEQTHWH